MLFLRHRESHLTGEWQFTVLGVGGRLSDLKAEIQSEEFAARMKIKEKAERQVAVRVLALHYDVLSGALLID